MRRGPPTTEQRIAQTARLDYRPPLPSASDTNDFRTLLEAYLPPPIARDTLLKLFEYRATYGAILNWRNGHCRAPNWAMDILRKKIAAQIEPLRAVLKT